LRGFCAGPAPACTLTSDERSSPDDDCSSLDAAYADCERTKRQKRQRWRTARAVLGLPPEQQVATARDVFGGAKGGSESP
jgi:hypothetical protein